MVFLCVLGGVLMCGVWLCVRCVVFGCVLVGVMLFVVCLC